MSLCKHNIVVLWRRIVLIINKNFLEIFPMLCYWLQWTLGAESYVKKDLHANISKKCFHHYCRHRICNPYHLPYIFLIGLSSSLSKLIVFPPWENVVNWNLNWSLFPVTVLLISCWIFLSTQVGLAQNYCVCVIVWSLRVFFFIFGFLLKFLLRDWKVGYVYYTHHKNDLCIPI